MEDQRKRLRLDESYEQIPHAAPELTAEQKEAIAKRHAQAKKEREGRANEEAPSAMEETSVFHGTKMKDYQGRSWLHPPAEALATRSTNASFRSNGCIHGRAIQRALLRS